MGLVTDKNASIRSGVATLTGGVAIVTVDKLSATDVILLTPQEDGNINGILRITERIVDTSFIITSSDATDTADVAWLTCSFVWKKQRKANPTSFSFRIID